MAVIRTFYDLEVYKLSHKLAMEIFEITKSFPREEKYSLTDQVRRSSRSVAANIAEGWGKRRHENLFKRFLIDACGSLEETKSWLLFARDCEYLVENEYERFIKQYERLGSQICTLHNKWTTF